MVKKILAVALVAGASGVLAQAETAAEQCSGFVAQEWSDFADTANQVCVAAATGELSDCVADADASYDEKSVYWAACSFGRGLGKGSSCTQFCAKLHFDHHLSKFFELGCKHTCSQVVKSHKQDSFFKCRTGLCSVFKIEACWRGCNYASGIGAGTDHTCEDC